MKLNNFGAGPFPLKSTDVNPASPPEEDKNFVKYKFESEGTFSYTDTENPQFSGIITILPSGESEEKISKPVQGIDQIVSSLGVK